MEPLYATAPEPSICYPPPSRDLSQGDQGDHCIPDKVVMPSNYLI